MKSSNTDSDVAFWMPAFAGHDTGPGCFIQGDRPEAGAELAMTDRELAHLFLRVA